MQILIEAFGLPGRTCPVSPGFPGYSDIHVAVQPRARDEALLSPQPGDAVSAAWTLDCTASRGASGVDFTGPWIQGRPGQRFIYLSWTGIDSAGVVTRFRRAKLMLDAVDSSVADDAVSRGRLVARLALTDAKGRPLCAAVRPPLVAWSSEAPH